MFLAIDLGTTGVKVALAEDSGRRIAYSYRTLSLETPRSDWVQQQPEAWWDACCSAASEVMDQASAAAKDIRMIGLSGQMHGPVFVNAAGEALYPCLTWADQRSAAQIGQLYDAMDTGTWLTTTGNLPAGAYTLPKLLWVKEHAPQVLDETAHILLPKDYLRLRMTGIAATDASDASGTLMYDIFQGNWCSHWAARFGYDSAWLPPVLGSDQEAGVLTERAAQALGLTAGTPVVTGAGDLACTCTALGLLQPGAVGVNIGTAGQALSALDDPQKAAGELFLFSHAVPGRFFALGSLFAAGLAFRWFRDTVGELEKAREKEPNLPSAYDLLVERASAVRPGSEGVLFLPHLTGSSTPYHERSDRGSFVGLRVHHGKGHMARAVLEGITFAMARILQVYRDCRLPVDEIRIGGGAVRSPFWQQLQADIYRQPVTPMDTEDAALTGAMIAAAVGSGQFSDWSEAQQQLTLAGNPVHPRPDAMAMYERYYPVYLQLREALGDVHRRLDDLE